MTYAKVILPAGVVDVECFGGPKDGFVFAPVGREIGRTTRTRYRQTIKGGAYCGVYKIHVPITGTRGRYVFQGYKG